MLVIRLSRFGKKKQPFYRIVVADSRSPIQGKYIEKIGHYNPKKGPPEIFIDKEKTKKWLKEGVKPSNTVWNLLVEAGILKKKIVTQRKKEKKKKAVKEEKPKKEEKPSSAEATEGKEETKEASEAKSPDLSAEVQKTKAEASGEGGKESEKEVKEETASSKTSKE